MRIRFISQKLHGLLDYTAAAGLITLPFLLDLSAQGAIGQWLSVAGGIALILYSLVTDYAFSAARMVPFKVHLALDLAAAVAFFVAPFVFEFTGLVAWYYFAMALGVVLVVALTNRNSTGEVLRPIPASSTNN